MHSDRHEILSYEGIQPNNINDPSTSQNSNTIDLDNNQVINENFLTKINNISVKKALQFLFSKNNNLFEILNNKWINEYNKDIFSFYMYLVNNEELNDLLSNTVFKNLKGLASISSYNVNTTQQQINDNLILRIKGFCKWFLNMNINDIQKLDNISIDLFKFIIECEKEKGCINVGTEWENKINIVNKDYLEYLNNLMKKKREEYDIERFHAVVLTDNVVPIYQQVKVVNPDQPLPNDPFAEKFIDYKTIVKKLNVKPPLEIPIVDYSWNHLYLEDTKHWIDMFQSHTNNEVEVRFNVTGLEFEKFFNWLIDNKSFFLINYQCEIDQFSNNIRRIKYNNIGHTIIQRKTQLKRYNSKWNFSVNISKEDKLNNLPNCTFDHNRKKNVFNFYTPKSDNIFFNFEVSLSVITKNSKLEYSVELERMCNQRILNKSYWNKGENKEQIIKAIEFTVRKLFTVYNEHPVTFDQKKYIKTQILNLVNEKNIFNIAKRVVPLQSNFTTFDDDDSLYYYLTSASLFYVSLKIDGLRHLLIVSNIGTFLCTLDNTYIRAGPPSCPEETYILDCEVLNNTIYVFDVIYNSSKDVSKLEFSKRYKSIKLPEVYNFYKILWKQFIPLYPVTSEPMYTRDGEINFIQDNEKYFDDIIKSLLNKSKSRGFDGLIFQEDTIVTSNKIIKTYKTANVYKWKPRFSNTIDLSMKFSLCNKNCEKMSWVDEYTFNNTFIGEVYKIRQLYISKYPCSKILLPYGTSFDLSNFVIETYIDKDTYEKEIPSIIPFKIRFDKVYPNTIKVIDSCVYLLKNPILSTDFLGKDLMFAKRISNLAKFSILSQFATDKIILDIGSGQGGDIKKWEHAKPKKIIAFEPNQVKLHEFKSRFKNSKLNLDLKETLFNVTSSKDLTADVIFDFFAVNYVFESEETLQDFVDSLCQINYTISQNIFLIVPNGDIIERQPYFYKYLYTLKNREVTISSYTTEKNVFLNKNIKVFKRKGLFGHLFEVNYEKSFVNKQQEYQFHIHEFLRRMSSNFEVIELSRLLQYCKINLARIPKRDIEFLKAFYVIRLQRPKQYSLPMVIEDENAYEYLDDDEGLQFDEAFKPIKKEHLDEAIDEMNLDEYDENAIDYEKLDIFPEETKKKKDKKIDEDEEDLDYQKKVKDDIDEYDGQDVEEYDEQVEQIEQGEVVTTSFQEQDNEEEYDTEEILAFFNLYINKQVDINKIKKTNRLLGNLLSYIGNDYSMFFIIYEIFKKININLPIWSNLNLQYFLSLNFIPDYKLKIKNKNLTQLQTLFVNGKFDDLFIPITDNEIVITDNIYTLDTDMRFILICKNINDELLSFLKNYKFKMFLCRFYSALIIIKLQDNFDYTFNGITPEIIEKGQHVTIFYSKLSLMLNDNADINYNKFIEPEFSNIVFDKLFLNKFIKPSNILINNFLMILMLSNISPLVYKYITDINFLKLFRILRNLESGEIKVPEIITTNNGISTKDQLTVDNLKDILNLQSIQTKTDIEIRSSVKIDTIFIDFVLFVNKDTKDFVKKFIQYRDDYKTNIELFDTLKEYIIEFKERTDRFKKIYQVDYDKTHNICKVILDAYPEDIPLLQKIDILLTKLSPNYSKVINNTSESILDEFYTVKNQFDTLHSQFLLNKLDNNMMNIYNDLKVRIEILYTQKLLLEDPLIIKYKKQKILVYNLQQKLDYLNVDQLVEYIEHKNKLNDLKGKILSIENPIIDEYKIQIKDNNLQNLEYLKELELFMNRVNRQLEIFDNVLQVTTKKTIISNFIYTIDKAKADYYSHPFLILENFDNLTIEILDKEYLAQGFIFTINDRFASIFRYNTNWYIYDNNSLKLLKEFSLPENIAYSFYLLMN